MKDMQVSLSFWSPQDENVVNCALCRKRNKKQQKTKELEDFSDLNKVSAESAKRRAIVYSFIPTNQSSENDMRFRN